MQLAVLRSTIHPVYRKSAAQGDFFHGIIMILPIAQSGERLKNCPVYVLWRILLLWTGTFCEPLTCAAQCQMKL